MRFLPNRRTLLTSSTCCCRDGDKQAFLKSPSRGCSSRWTVSKVLKCP